MRGKEVNQKTSDVTEILNAHARGDRAAASRLMPLVYTDLKALAVRYMAKERPDHTLQPTALVHEAYVRLVNITRVDWKGKSHFFAMAARQMRRILVEHARAHNARKRGAEWARITLDEGVAMTPGGATELLDLDEALEQLANLNQRHCRVAELRFFAGLDVKETAYVLGVSERTIKKDWRMARAWLLNALGP